MTVAVSPTATGGSCHGATGTERATKARASEGSLSEAPSAKIGAEDWNRTSDTSIFSAVLYQLSYLGTRQLLSSEPR